MPPDGPRAGCFEVVLREPLALGEPAQVALEDYARSLTRAGAAEVLRGGEAALVTGVHVCEAPSRPSQAALADIEAFAAGLAEAGQSAGLGWS
jgi:hypothetical protein